MIQLHIPELMPNEYILGYLGRISAVNGIKGEQTLRAALREWYKHRNGSTSEGTLIEHLAYASGMDTYHFACHHTLIPAYRAVASHLHQQRHGDPSDFGLLSAHAPRLMRNDIQLCTECIKEDIDYLGFTFWRRSHQLPGIDWCLKHATPLCKIMGNKLGLLEQPNIAFESLREVVLPLDEIIEANPVVSRYAEILQVVLDFKSPIAPQAITPLLAKKARQMGLRANPKGNKPVLSDIALEMLPTTWIKKHFPSLLQKKPNEFLYEYDGVCKPGGKAHASTSYILATAVLCETVQVGQRLLWEAIHTAPADGQTNAAAKPISYRRMKSAYISSNGNIKRMANLMKCKYKSLLVTTKAQGLPTLTNASIGTLQALQDFYDKKASLQDILKRPDVQISNLSEILRTAASPHAKLLSGIVNNHQFVQPVS